MGLQMSSLNALIVGDTMDKRYDLYKILTLSDIEYFKVEDMLDFNIKKTVEPALVQEKMEKNLFMLVNLIDHPNLIRSNWFVEDGLFYVVRTYEDDYYAFAWRLQIQRYLETRRKNIEIEENQIIYWIMQLLMAVDALHQHNILHKFIIPEAISFKRDRLKLFVPARSTILQNGDQYVEEGRTWYRAPEHDQIKAIGLKYDIWSAGWSLYNFCALEDARFVLDQVISFSNWVVPDIPRRYSRDIDRLFKQMTVFDPDQRPSAIQLLQDPIFDRFRST